MNFRSSTKKIQQIKVDDDGIGRREDGREIISKTPSSSPNKGTAWQKKLYIKQDFPDNYVDISFLKLMKKNANVKTLKYWKIVGESGRVTQQISVVFIFVALYYNLAEMRDDDYDAFTFFGMAGSLLSFCCYLIYTSRSAPSRIGSSLMSALLFTGVLAFMTPILKNLTKDISTDSIWALTVVMLIANLLFHNYDSLADSHTRFPDSISINAAMFASVLLASRLDSNPKVLLLMFSAVALFALLPIFRRCIRRSWRNAPFIDTLMAIIFAVTYLYISQSLRGTIVYLTFVFGITFLCPLLLVRLQRYKTEIKGPWDEAKPI